MDSAVVRPTSLKFGIVKQDEIPKIAVLRITSPDQLSDPKLGIIKPKIKCPHCDGDFLTCPGAFGYMEWKRPIIHPMFYRESVPAILKIFCYACKKIVFGSKLTLEPEFSGLSNESRFDETWRRLKTLKQCVHCSYPLQNFVSNAKEHEMHRYDATLVKSERSLYPVTDQEIAKIFSSLDPELVTLIGLDYHPRDLALTRILVLPPVDRPPVVIPPQTIPDDLTVIYTQMLKKLPDDSSTEKEIQQFARYLTILIDNSFLKGTDTRSRVYSGLGDRIRGEGKTGQIRGNLNGKRVNFSGRTVIVPDPELPIDTVGIPSCIADEITYPEVVNAFNIERLQTIVNAGLVKRITNGVTGNRTIPNQLYNHRTCTHLLPGDHIIRDGEEILASKRPLGFALKRGDKIIRDGIEFAITPKVFNTSQLNLSYEDTVFRPMRDGDIVLLNRQPSLHRFSMMGFKVKIHAGRAITLPPNIVTPYNADFDGDEMNLHLPSTVESRAEAILLCGVKNSMLSYLTHGSTFTMIQDTSLTVYKMSIDESPFYADLFDSIIMSFVGMDCIQEKERLKKVCNELDVDMYSNRSLLAMIFPRDLFFTSANVTIKYGRVMSGYLTSKDLGKIIAIFAKYRDTPLEEGNFETNPVHFITNLQRISSRWLNMTGHSLGISDCKPIKSSKIRASLHESLQETRCIEEETDSFRKETKIVMSLASATNTIHQMVETTMSPDNRFIPMFKSGAKGNMAACAQICGIMGQQFLLGNRIPRTLNNAKRVLPHQKVNEEIGTVYNLIKYYRRDGFISSNLYNGLLPEEWFLHAVASRESIGDTALKTAQGGYIQRKLVKTMEDIVIAQDGTVRTKEMIMQMVYGVDGIAPEHTVIVNDTLTFANLSTIASRLNAQVSLKN